MCPFKPLFWHLMSCILYIEIRYCRATLFYDGVSSTETCESLKEDPFPTVCEAVEKKQPILKRAWVTGAGSVFTGNRFYNYSFGNSDQLAQSFISALKKYLLEIGIQARHHEITSEKWARDFDVHRGWLNVNVSIRSDTQFIVNVWNQRAQSELLMVVPKVTFRAKFVIKEYRMLYYSSKELFFTIEMQTSLRCHATLHGGRTSQSMIDNGCSFGWSNVKIIDECADLPRLVPEEAMKKLRFWLASDVREKWAVLFDRNNMAETMEEPLQLPSMLSYILLKEAMAM